MPKKKVLIISCLPLYPVRSGFQNTNYLLFKFLEKKFKVNFLNVNNINKYDPVINLSVLKIHYSKILSYNPDIVFVTTTKLSLIIYDFLKKIEKKPIIICHDLYNFRKNYFKKNKIEDKNPLSKSDELKIIKLSKFIFDISKEEEKYLLKENIPRNKILFTHTPVEFKNKISFKKKKYDFIFSGSNWFQNTLNINKIFNQKINIFKDKKILIMGPKKTNFLIKYKQIKFKKFNKNHYVYSKIGLAPIKHKNGRNVKIFEMLSYGLPVFTNVNLKKYGLENEKHYFLIKNNNWQEKLSSYYYKDDFLNFVGMNARVWSKKNSNYLNNFKKILNKI